MLPNFGKVPPQNQVRRSTSYSQKMPAAAQNAAATPMALRGSITNMVTAATTIRPASMLKIDWRNNMPEEFTTKGAARVTFQPPPARIRRGDRVEIVEYRLRRGVAVEQCGDDHRPPVPRADLFEEADLGLAALGQHEDAATAQRAGERKHLRVVGES